MDILKRNEKRIELRKNIQKNIVEHELESIDLVNKIITLLYDFNNQVSRHYAQESNKNEFLQDMQKQAIQTLFWRCISQIESILILIENGKYIEAVSILRNLFEGSITLLYIKEYPFEAERWLNWGNMKFDETQRYKENNKNFNKFKSFLEEKGYNDLLKLKLVNKQNFKGYRDFKPWLIRKMAFEKNPSMKGTVFDEFYHKTSKYVHPSIKSLFHNDRWEPDQFKDVIKDILYFAENMTNIFIEFFQKVIDKSTIQEYENIKNEPLP